MSVAKYKDPSTGEWTPIGLSVGGTSGMEMDLLWENASSTSGFPAQTVELELSEYDCVEIVGVYDSYGTRLPSTVVEVGQSGYITGVCPYDTGYVIGVRLCRVDITGVRFGVSDTLQNGVYTRSESRIVPVKIYGIKNVNKGGN